MFSPSLDSRHSSAIELSEAGEATRLIPAKTALPFDAFIVMASHLTSMPECEDSLGRLFYLATLREGDDRLPLTTKDVAFLQAAQEPPRTFWQEQCRPLVMGATLMCAFTGTMGLRFLDSRFKIIGVVALVAAVASASLACIAYYKGAYETKEDVRCANRERYRNISNCLLSLNECDPASARRLSLRLDIATIQASLAQVTDAAYSASICAHLQKAKNEVLSAQNSG